jgi:ubiquinone/menaquinone biosynthesis C-methylase UbiE
MSAAPRFAHPMMPQTSHDEMALEAFLVSMRGHVMQEMDPIDRRLVTEHIAPRFAAARGKPATTSAEIRKELEAEPYHQAWLTLQRLYQDMLWSAIGESVDRQHAELDTRRRALTAPKGSLRLDPALPVPRYIGAFDHHRMAGSYHTEAAPEDFRPGAMYDRYASTYHYWRNGGWMNDGRGHTLASHIASSYPQLKPRRILDMGCAVGHSTVALKDDFPDAEIHAIDVAAPMLRYAHARAEYMGREIHFSQQNAEHTNFPDGHFDLVVSAVALHETSHAAMRNIFRESFRLLQPGGVMAHLEVPGRYDQMGLWEQVRVDFEAHYNNEPFMAGVARADFAKIAIESGFQPADVMAGFRQYTPAMTKLESTLAAVGAADGKLPMGSWYICSAIRR